MASITRSSKFIVTSLDTLNTIYKKPKEMVLTKVTDHITAPGRSFIAASPFIMLATVSDDGVDCSPKGDAPGFVQLLDDRTLLIPDRPGNNRIDGMKNIIANPKVGIIFMVPGANDTYRVNGTAQISVDPELLSRFVVQGQEPRAVIVVRVENAHNHCPKAFVRSKLWGEQNKRPEGVPTIGDFAANRTGADKAFAENFDAEYEKGIPDALY
jgi:PPOX class probable FMN-dependent enzyme